MTNFEHSIQHHDYSIKNGGKISKEDALKLVNWYSWEGDFLNYNKRDQLRDCPFGIEFNKVGDTLHMIHVWPHREWDYTVIFHYPLKRNILNIFSYTQRKDYCFQNVDKNMIPQIVELFFDEKNEEIVNLLSKK